MRVRKAVFPVAGPQTAFLPATKGAPKDLLAIVDTPLIQFAVDEALAAGVEELVFVERPGAMWLRSYFERDPAFEERVGRAGGEAALERLGRATLGTARAQFVVQRESRGLGDAVLCAREAIGDEPFAVILPDDLIDAAPPALAQMAARYPRYGGAMIAGIEVTRTEVARYGIMRIEDTGGDVVAVHSLVEKPDADAIGSNFAVVGRYILPPEIFEALAATGPDARGAVQLTDAIQRLAGRTRLWGARFQGERFDCGAPGGMVRATIALAARRPDIGRETLAYMRRILDRADAARR